MAIGKKCFVFLPVFIGLFVFCATISNQFQKSYFSQILEREIVWKKEILGIRFASSSIMGSFRLVVGAKCKDHFFISFRTTDHQKADYGCRDVLRLRLEGSPLWISWEHGGAAFPDPFFVTHTFHISEYNHIQSKIGSNFRGFLIRCKFSPSLNRQRMLLYDVMLQVFDYKLACEIVMIPDSTDPFTSPCYRITPKQVTDTRLCTFSA